MSTSMELDLRLVRYAVAVAEELHFGRAAARLMISEQTLSAQIKAFEERLGVVLFHRDRRHVELTPVGRVLVDRGRQLLADARDLVDEVTRAPALLRIDILAEGLTPSVIVEWLSVRLQGVVMEIHQGQGLATSASHLLSGELDLACGRTWAATNRATYGHLPVRLDPVGLMLPADHALAGHAEVRMAELAEFPLLVFAAAEAAEWQSWQEETVAEFGLMRSAVVHGHGIGAARLAVLAHGQPHLCSMDVPSSEAVVVRPLVDPIPLYLWSVVWRAGRHDAHLKEITNVIEECSEELRWLIPPESSWWIPEIDRQELRLTRHKVPEPTR
jgi:DNA-binding transcriptional LysR family regulator